MDLSTSPKNVVSYGGSTVERRSTDSTIDTYSSVNTILLTSMWIFLRILSNTRVDF